MTHNRFNQICTAMGIGPGNPTAVLGDGGPPRLTAQYHAPGGGFQEAIVVELEGSPHHVTLYQTSWDGSVLLPGNFGPVHVGPYALHLTSGTTHWYYVVENNGSLRSRYPDIGAEPTERTRTAMDKVFMPVLTPYLFS